MKREEYLDLEDFLFARFPELESWFANMSESRRSETQAAWREATRRVDLDDAKEVVRLIHAGEETEPKSFSRWPAAIATGGRRLGQQARAASRRSTSLPRVVDGEYVYDCLQCRDIGMVTVWHPQTLAELAGGDLATLYTAVVACTCKAGGAYRRWMRELDPEADLPLRRQDSAGVWRDYRLGDPAETEAAREWAARTKATQIEAF